MVRIKKIKSGYKYYYYVIKDVYSQFQQRSVTEIVRKATDEEIEEFERNLALKETMNAKYQIVLYLKTHEIKFLNFENYEKLREEINKILENIENIKKIIINFL